MANDEYQVGSPERIAEAAEDKRGLLNLAGLGISELPTEIGELKSLEVLYLHNNQLSELPADIGELKSLQVLNLSNNQLSELPADIGELKSLE